MGAKESKQFCISYEDAVKRVSESELQRLNDAFKKSAGVGRLYLSRKAFQQEVLFEGVPPNVTELLYRACGGSQKGISFKDLLCGLVLLTRGTEQEKTKFLWNLYCNDAGTYILKNDYMKAVNLNNFDVLSLFGQSDRVAYEQFQDWCVRHKHLTVLSKWLLSEPCISLTSELETPTFYQSLAGVTHLEEKDIGDLEKEFWCLKNFSANGQLDLQLLGPLISPPIPKNALRGLFNAFDENRDGHIDFKELCCGVSAACRGPSVERTRFCFKIFDLDSDGVLNNQETLRMIKVLLYVAKENRKSQLYRELTEEQTINDIVAFIMRQNETNTKRANHNAQLARNGGELVNAKNVLLTAEDFMMWSVGGESGLKLVQPFLDLTFEVCHIVFGLWPQCRHMEYEIVHGWLKREEKRQYRVGQFWYLISRDWWLSWLQYTQSIADTCEYCKKTCSRRGSNLGVDEAAVCDESFDSSAVSSDNCSLNSASSGISAGRRIGQRPGPIDNSNLITANPYSKVRTLTGEGGHLKRDTPLVQNHDFELVPKSLWKAFSRWYGDNLPLPRQVIQPPNTPAVELELYPLNLRILLHESQANGPLNSWNAVSGGYGIMASGYAAMSSQSLQPPKRYLAYTAAFSHLATIRQIGEFLCDQLSLKVENTRLWHVSDNATMLLEEEPMTLRELAMRDSDQILLEIRNKDLTWPEELGSLALEQRPGGGVGALADRRMTRASILSVQTPGATGLHNLGNTCFMNAALQVLFNTQPLAQYFRRNMHLLELNRANKLGTHGHLATSYADLLREVWSANARSVAPLKLRLYVTKYAQQFAGGGQHDSQELLEWLLDALHEDLNRVMDKPYSELKDSNGRPDKIVAAEAWSQHHARNQSVIIDLFYGQLKSKVCCQCCGRESVRFDPFSLLSLPLPVENYVYFEVLVILLDGAVPTKYGLRLNSDCKYFELKYKLAQLSGLNSSYMLICEIRNAQISQILNDEQKIKQSTAKELVVYQLPEEMSDQASATFSVHIEQGLKDIQRNSSALVSAQDSLSSLNYTSHQAFGRSVDSFEESALHNGSRTDHDEHSNDDSCQHNNANNECAHEAAASAAAHNNNFDVAKQSSDISRSPEDTFTHASMRPSLSAKLLQKNMSITSDTNDANETSLASTTTNTANTNTTEPVSLNSSPASNAGERRNALMHGSTANSSSDTNATGGSAHFAHLPDGAHASLEARRVGRYLVAVHRKITRQDSYFLSYHKTRPSLFGVPLLIANCGGAHKDLYCAVWLQIRRLLSPLPASTEQANHAADCDDSLGYDFPFSLRAVKRDGLTCALCPWSSFCRGCEIPCNNDDLLVAPLLTTDTSTPTTPQSLAKYVSASNFESNMQLGSFSALTKCISLRDIDELTIAIDWDPTALHLRYQSSLERLWSEHETVAICRREQTEPVDLNHCLRAFTSEEKLEQWYHCAHCKGKKSATKKLQIWKLPPILIVHLKRFNYVNNKWVKSQKVVHFPFDDFDPTPYLASVPQETILRHRELLDLQSPEQVQQHEPLPSVGEGEALHSLNAINKTQQLNGDNGNNDQSAVARHIANLDNASNLQLDDCSNIVVSNNEAATAAPGSNGSSTATRRFAAQAEKRKRLISSSLVTTPIVDGEFEDYHQHKLRPGADKFDPKYKLYAVVSHSGMLSGGHYVSYAANQNGNWYCYNDSSCREIHEQPHIDPSSAYLLFYERHDLDYEPYLPSAEGKTAPPDPELGLDGSDSELKKPCAIS